MMKYDVDTGPNSLVEKFRVDRLLYSEMFLEKLVESLMLKRRQLTLNQNLRERSSHIQATKSLVRLV
jgi:hypothetical protein